MLHRDRLLIMLYAGAILLLHTIPTGSASVGTGETAGVKTNHLVHLVMFLPWGLLTLKRRNVERVALLSRALGWLALGLLLAACAEGVQNVLPYRSFNFPDLFMNFTGVTAGLAVACLWRSKLLVLPDRNQREPVHHARRSR